MQLWRKTSDPQMPLKFGASALPLAVLNAFRLRANARARSGSNGIHLRRKKGQALDFREHRSYQPGDDIRRVDWRASSRVGRDTDLVVRLFDAEERLSVLVIVDFRPTMFLPEGCQKASIAMHLARSIAFLAERSRDQLMLIVLGTDLPAFGSQGRGTSKRAETYLERAALRAQELQDGTKVPVQIPETAQAMRASAAIVISDFYFDQNKGLSEVLSGVQRHFGSVLAVEIDSWPIEAAALSKGPVRLAAIDGWTSGDRPSEASADHLAEARRRARTHVIEIQDQLDFGAFHRTRWQLDTLAVNDPASWFAGHLTRDKALVSILGKER